MTFRPGRAQQTTTRNALRDTGEELPWFMRLRTLLHEIAHGCGFAVRTESRRFLVTGRQRGRRRTLTLPGSLYACRSTLPGKVATNVIFP